MNRRDELILKMANRSQGVCFRVEENVAAIKRLNGLGYLSIEEHGFDVIGRITRAGRAALSSQQQGTENG